MTSKPKKQKPKIFWAIVDETGFIYPRSLRTARVKCADEFRRQWTPAMTVLEYKIRKLRCVKVKVEEV